MLKKEPALAAGLVAAVIAAVAQAVQAGQAGGAGFNWLAAVVVAAPLAAGIATRFHVVSAETLRDIVGRARSAAAVVTAIADKVDVPSTDRPYDRPAEAG